MSYVGKQPQPKFLGQVDDLTVAGDANIDTNTLVVDATNNRVGIGTSTPSNGNLNIVDDNPSIRFDDTSTTNNGEITVDNTSIRIEADPSNSTADSNISLQVDGSEKMRIDSSGAVLVNNLSALESEKLRVTGTNGSLALDPGDFFSHSVAIFENDGECTVTIASDSASSGLLRFTDVDGNSGEIEYDHASDYMAFATNAAEAMRIDSSGYVGMGTTSPLGPLHVALGSAGGGSVSAIADDLIVERSGNTGMTFISPNNTSQTIAFADPESSVSGYIQYNHPGDYMRFITGGSESARISGGSLYVNKTSTASGTTTDGHVLTNAGIAGHTSTDQLYTMYVARAGTDGNLVRFYAQGNFEGYIGVSGSTVTYSGGHLARWAQLPSNTKDESIVKGTVMTNLDEMCVWEHDAVEAQDAVYDEDGNVVTEAVEAKEAYTEDNEQLNKMAISSVEGDPNVAGVFVSWDEDDDMSVAMTGDMVIRIAQDTTVQRGDLLMSAGDGTAKPQGDDIVRSKTIAKVTSTHVSHTYDDGSYLVPCVLMAC